MDAIGKLNKTNKAAKSKDVKVTDSRKLGSHSVGGRPKKKANEKRTHKITVYFSTDELDTIQSYCESMGVQPAVFLRTQAINSAKNNF